MNYNSEHTNVVVDGLMDGSLFLDRFEIMPAQNQFLTLFQHPILTIDQASLQAIIDQILTQTQPLERQKNYLRAISLGQ